MESRLPQRLRVAVLTAIGYAYICFAFAVMLAIVAASVVAIFLFFAFTIEFIRLLRSQFVRTPRVEGVRLSRHAAPRFHALVREVQRTLGTPRVSEILVDTSFNAAAARRPRLWRLLPDRATVVVGLPLFYALTIEELRAVLGHELSHIANRDVEALSSAYRLRVRCAQLWTALDRTRFPFARFFRPFFSWFVPRFDRAMFERSRASEVRADAGAARVTDPETVARELVKFNACSRFLEEHFWPNVTDRAVRVPHPPENVLDELHRALLGVDGESDLEQWLESAESDPGAWFDTHPSLGARLDALGVPRPALRLTLASSASAELLGPSEEELRRAVNADWCVQSESWWQGVFEHAQTARDGLRELERSATEVPELLEQASVTAWLEGPDAALPVWQAVLELDPASAEANAGVGITLLDRSDKRGLAHIERALDGSTRIALDSALAAARYLDSEDRVDEARRFHVIAADRAALLQDAMDERDVDPKEWKFEAHGLDEDTVAGVRAKVLEVVKTDRVYLARRTLHVLGDEFPTFVLVVLRKRRVIERMNESSKLKARLLDAIHLPGTFYVAVSHDMTDDVVKTFQKVDGALIVGTHSRRKRAIKASLVAVVGGSALVSSIFFAASTTPPTLPPIEPPGYVAEADRGAGSLTVDAQQYQVFSVEARAGGARTRVVVSSLLRPLNGSRPTVPTMWLRDVRGGRYKPVLGRRRVQHASSVYTKVTDVYLVPRAQVHGLELVLPNAVERQVVPLTLT